MEEKVFQQEKSSQSTLKMNDKILFLIKRTRENISKRQKNQRLIRSQKQILFLGMLFPEN